MNNYPLVSIAVITYNSAAYILDGLESIKNQTYKNIELIISDDCSTDNTTQVCQQWIEENRNYFKRTVLVTTEKNSGVAGNLNRAFRECNGEWIKVLSGDDKFFSFTVEGYIEFINNNPSCNIAFAKLHFYGECKELVNNTRLKYENNFYPKIRAPYKTQYKENLIELFLPGPGIIVRKTLWDKVEGFDEEFPFCEEIPFTTKVLDLGERIYFIDKELYRYHVRKGSISKTKSKVYYTLRNNIRSYFRKVNRKKMIRNGLVLHAIDKTISYNLEEAIENNSKIRIILYSTMRYLSPIRYQNNIRNIIKKYYTSEKNHH